VNRTGLKTCPYSKIDRSEDQSLSNNPAELRRKIMKLQKRLLKLIFLKEEIRKKDEKDEQDFEYII